MCVVLHLLVLHWHIYGKHNIFKVLKPLILICLHRILRGRWQRPGFAINVAYCSADANVGLGVSYACLILSRKKEMRWSKQPKVRNKKQK